MTALTQPEISTFLARNPTWQLSNGELTREWKFPGFLAAMAFVNQVAAAAEAAGHHPGIDIRYNRVRLALITHDARGITANDTAMAEQLSALPA
jgi:4a-hydroxytetrahydrobiopterin dehydratase